MLRYLGVTYFNMSTSYFQMVHLRINGKEEIKEGRKEREGGREGRVREQGNTE